LLSPYPPFLLDVHTLPYHFRTPLGLQLSPIWAIVLTYCLLNDAFDFVSDRREDFFVHDLEDLALEHFGDMLHVNRR
jgi:hypothetical protein